MSEPQLAGGFDRLQGRKESGKRQGTCFLPVHATGIFLPGQQGLLPRTFGVQPLRQLEGQF